MPNEPFNTKDLVEKLFLVLRETAREGGFGCSLPGCSAIVVGVRCEHCVRKICVGHTYWSLSDRRALPSCPYCVLKQNKDLFRDESNDDNDVNEGSRARSGSEDDSVIDGSFEEA